MSSTAHGTNRQGLILLLICVAQFMVVLDFSIVNVALPAIQQNLGISTENLQWIISAYALSFGGFLLLGGRMADLYGRRLLFIIGLILFSVTSLAGGFATSGIWLITTRAIQGLGAAIVSPAALSLITTTFAEGHERNKAFGFFGSVSSVGFAAGALLGGILTSGPGWRWVMFINVPIGIIAVIAAPLLLKESLAQVEQRRIDVFGAITVTAGLILLVYAISLGNVAGWLSAQTIGLLTISIALLVIFVFLELRLQAPLVNLNVFRSRSVTGANIVNLFVPAAFGSFIFVLTLYLQQILGFSAIMTGIAFLPMALAVLIVSNIVSRLASRVGVKAFIVGGLVFLIVGLALLSPMTVNGNYLSTLLPGILIASLGIGATFPATLIAATAGISDDEQGMASGIFTTTQEIGSGLGLAIVSAVAAASTATFANPGKVALSAGFHTALFVCVGFAVAAIIAALFIIQRQQTSGPSALQSLEEDLENSASLVNSLAHSYDGELANTSTFELTNEPS
jgi:EmrB/QacA subfamily drug resistance transporter